MNSGRVFSAGTPRSYLKFEGMFAALKASMSVSIFRTSWFDGSLQ